jgi:hypothetical protein
MKTLPFRIMVSFVLCLGFSCAPLLSGAAPAASAYKQCDQGWQKVGPFVTGKASPAYEYDSYDTYSDWLRVRTLGGEEWNYVSQTCKKTLHYQYGYEDRLEVCNPAGHFGCTWNGDWGRHDGLNSNGTQRLKAGVTPYCWYENAYGGYFAEARLTLNTSNPGL